MSCFFHFINLCVVAVYSSIITDTCKSLFGVRIIKYNHKMQENSTRLKSTRRRSKYLTWQLNHIKPFVPMMFFEVFTKEISCAVHLSQRFPAYRRMIRGINTMKLVADYFH